MENWDVNVSWHLKSLLDGYDYGLNDCKGGFESLGTDPCLSLTSILVSQNRVV